jgi:hypothetical protein
MTTALLPRLPVSSTSLLPFLRFPLCWRFAVEVCFAPLRARCEIGTGYSRIGSEIRLDSTYRLDGKLACCIRV